MNSNFFDIKDNVSCLIETVGTSSSVFDEDALLEPKRIPGTDYQYIPFGADDNLPYDILKLIGRDEIMSQNMQFNTQTCYASGLQYMDYTTDKPTKNPAIRRFLQRNSIESFFMEQITDMKHFYFSVDVIILSKDRSEIVQVRHKEACFCRFEKADKNGKINHVFYGDFREYGLYIFCKDELTQEEVKLTMEYTNELQRNLDVKYSKMYLSLIDRLYVCDLTDVNPHHHPTTKYTSYEISRRMCKDFFLKSLDL